MYKTEAGKALKPRILSGVFFTVSWFFFSSAHAQTSVFVIPNQPWTDTGISVTAGQALAITATGEMDYNTNNTCPEGQSCTVGPNGSNPPAPCTGQPVTAPNLVCNSLIGLIGSSGTPFQVGTSLNLASVPVTGELYLGVNDGYFADNTLGWTASVSLSAPETCSIVATTLAHVPGTDDSMRPLTGRIGVGENVTLKLTSGDTATWSIASGDGTLTPDITAVQSGAFPSNEGFPTEQCSGDSSSTLSGVQACFTAPDKNSSIVVTAVADGSSCSAKITVVQPEGLLFQRMQYPKNNPNFFLEVFGTEYQIRMESIAFVTPGDVSFANTLFKEEDVFPKEKQHYARHFNALLNIANTPAWLVGCDFDRDFSDERADPTNPKQFPVAYKGNADDIPFSLVQTEWSRHTVGFFSDFIFQKGQVSALNRSGKFLPTPNAPSAILKVPNVPPLFFWNDLVGIDNGKSCLSAVESQFTLIP